MIVIEAMASTKAAMPHLHMPLQSGSDKVLQAMRRSYRRDRYMGIIEDVRKAMPDAGITTDIIVGFPGETEDDFEQTLDIVRQDTVYHCIHFSIFKASWYSCSDDA